MEPPAAPPEPTPPTHERQRFTPFGAVTFALSVLLLISRFTGWFSGAEDIMTRLAHGFAQVNTFAFASNYITEFKAAVVNGSTGSASMGLFLMAAIVALPQAMLDSVQGGGWAVVGFVLTLALGALIMWDTIVTDHQYFWGVVAIPFVGGVAAWFLSKVLIQFVFWSVIAVLQSLVLLSAVSDKAPRLSGTIADLLDKFHLTKSVASDASRVFGRGKIAGLLERIEKEPPHT
jgi:hypothetical protein